MALTGNHQPGEPGHNTDHNLIDAALLTKAPSEGAILTRPVLSSVREEITTSNASSLTISFAPSSTAPANNYRSTYVGALTITWADIPAASSGIIVASTLIVAGPTSIVWPAGTKFNSGATPNLTGESWFSIVAHEGYVSVATAWTGVA